MAVKRLLSLQLVTVLALTVLVVGGSRLGVPARSAPVPFEVWLIDQSDTTGLPYGGTLRIYSGADVTGSNPSAAAPTDVIDLGAETAAVCRATTGADPVRPHMVTFNNADTHAAIAFVASGHVAILDAVTRRPLACVRTEVGAGGARQAHALWPTEDDRYLVVANQNGKKLERIRTDYAANAFVQEPEATLDLANGGRIYRLDASSLTDYVVEWPNGGMKFPKQDIRSPKDFEQMAKLVRPEDFKGRMLISSDLETHRKEIQRYLDMGFTKIYLHNVGGNQSEFIATFGEKVLPALTSS